MKKAPAPVQSKQGSPAKPEKSISPLDLKMPNNDVRIAVCSPFIPEHKVFLPIPDQPVGRDLYYGVEVARLAISIIMGKTGFIRFPMNPLGAFGLMILNQSSEPEAFASEADHHAFNYKMRGMMGAMELLNFIEPFIKLDKKIQIKDLNKQIESIFRGYGEWSILYSNERLTDPLYEHAKSRANKIGLYLIERLDICKQQQEDEAIQAKEKGELEEKKIVEQQRIAKEELEKKQTAQMIEQEKAEQQRIEKDKAESQRIAQKQKLDQQKAEEETKKLEEQKLAEEKIVQEKLTQEKLAAEEAFRLKQEEEIKKKELEKIELEKIEQERIEKQKIEEEEAVIAAKKAEEDKIAQEKIEQAVSVEQPIQVTVPDVVVAAPVLEQVTSVVDIPVPTVAVPEVVPVSVPIAVEPQPVVQPVSEPVIEQPQPAPATTNNASS